MPAHTSSNHTAFHRVFHSKPIALSSTHRVRAEEPSQLPGGPPRMTSQ